MNKTLLFSLLLTFIVIAAIAVGFVWLSETPSADPLTTELPTIDDAAFISESLKGTHRIFLYDHGLYEQKSDVVRELISFYEDTDGYDFIDWSPNGDRVGVVVINQQTQRAGGHEDLINATNLYIITFTSDDSYSVSRYDMDIAWTCGGRCAMYENAVTWIDQHTLEYSTQEDAYSGNYLDDELPRYMLTIE